MKGGNQRASRELSAAEQITDALPHFVRGLVGEGDGDDGRAGHAVRLHQVGHSMRDDARLPAARAGQEQERTFDVGDGGLLLRIKALEKIHLRVADQF